MSIVRRLGQDHRGALGLPLERAQRDQAPSTSPLVRRLELLTRPVERRRPVLASGGGERAIPCEVEWRPTSALGGEREADALGGVHAPQ